MKRPFVALAALLAIGLVAPLSAPALASPAAPQPDFGYANDQMGVLIEHTVPSAGDPHEHVRFTRHGGTGQRQVRIAERQTLPRTAVTYSKPVKLRVGQKAVFTTVGAMPCAPEMRPLKVYLQMRVKLPGRGWWPWFSYNSETHYLMDC